MSDEVVTLATFTTPAEAQLAKSMLEERGIKVMIADEETVGMAWHLGGALGGVKLLVLESQWMQARVALAEHQERLDDDDNEPDGPEDFGDDSPEEPDEQITARPPANAHAVADEDTDEQIAARPMRLGAEPGLEEPEPIVISEGEDLAGRAFRAALFGIVMVPPIFHLYSAWLLCKLFRWDGELSNASIGKALLALVIDGVMLIFAGLIVLMLLAHAGH